MYTNLVMLIVGVAGFIVCISISAHSLRFPNLMRNIALVFAWVALSGIAFSVTDELFPENLLLALLAAGAEALVLMILGTLVFCWCFGIKNFLKNK
jgi:hypothetical protein